jgi:bifunctional non-homologous end joining protein LigD
MSICQGGAQRRRCGVGKRTTTITVGAVQISLSSAEKVLFPEDDITKGDLVEYYRTVAGVMVPHLTGRPLTLHRFPSGIDGQKFYQKNASEHFPGWIHRATLRSQDGGDTEYVIADDEATIVYLANQNCIVFHPCSTRAPELHKPDLLILDLDPSDNDFEKVREGAQRLRGILSQVGLVPFLKTTGSRGLHVVAPIVPEEDEDGVRQFARLIADVLVREAPDVFTVEMSKVARGRRVFVDHLRNGKAQTAVAPYSVRALPGAPVAMPIRWAELDDPALDARRYRLRDAPAVLEERGDVWRDIRLSARPLGPARLKLGM